jgi:acyl-coenzyme A thioesterase PaaI-like protein
LKENGPGGVSGIPIHSNYTLDRSIVGSRPTAADNALLAVHGGCLMSFADFALFWIAGDELPDMGAVTVSFSSEFLDNAQEGDLIEAGGEVLRATRSMVFVRGLISSGSRPLLSFSATLKKLRAKDSP